MEQLMIGEIWKPVPGIKLFAASNLGRVRGPRGRTKRWTIQIIPQYDDTYGYKTVYCRDLRKPMAVHRLVCLAFHGTPSSRGSQVRHLDGIKHNNNERNLRWGTVLENSRDRDMHGNTRKGSTHRNAKLTESDVVEIRRLHCNTTKAALARQYRVTEATIYYIVSGKGWKHVA